MRTKFVLPLILLFVLSACFATTKPAEPADTQEPAKTDKPDKPNEPNEPPKVEDVLFLEDFDKYPDGSKLPPGWWVEGNTNATIENGHLRMNCNPPEDSEEYIVSTVWVDKMFSGDLRIDFDTHVLDSFDNKNNINFFFLFYDQSGKPLYKTRAKRKDGKYSRYHKLSGYVFTFLANGRPEKARFRMRDDPGFNLIQEVNDYNCYMKRTYHVTITKIGARITYAVDGTVYMDKLDDEYAPEHKEGLLGFRTFKTDLWWDNLKVTRP